MRTILVVACITIMVPALAGPVPDSGQRAPRTVRSVPTGHWQRGRAELRGQMMAAHEGLAGLQRLIANLEKQRATMREGAERAGLDEFLARLKYRRYRITQRMHMLEGRRAGGL